MRLTSLFAAIACSLLAASCEKTDNRSLPPDSKNTLDGIWTEWNPESLFLDPSVLFFKDGIFSSATIDAVDFRCGQDRSFVVLPSRHIKVSDFNGCHSLYLGIEQLNQEWMTLKNGEERLTFRRAYRSDLEPWLASRDADGQYLSPRLKTYLQSLRTSEEAEAQFQDISENFQNKIIRLVSPDFQTVSYNDIVLNGQILKPEDIPAEIQDGYCRIWLVHTEKGLPMPAAFPALDVSAFAFTALNNLRTWKQDESPVKSSTEERARNALSFKLGQLTFHCQQPPSLGPLDVDALRKIFGQSAEF